ncbi:MAG: InlB B-repeat-containing protein [Clostridia bacterium]|nr:InlB B-repeat-containing protein [Clostridia bacterium]
MKAKRIFPLLTVILTAILLIWGITAKNYGENPVRSGGQDFRAKLLDDGSVTIIKDGKTDFRIVFSSDTSTADQEFASELRSELRTRFGVNVRSVSDVTTPTDYEILIGNTNRALSAELLDTINAHRDGDNLVWGIIYKDGKLAYAASSDEAFAVGQKDFLALIGESEFTVSDSLFLLFHMTRDEYEQLLKEEQDRIEAEKEAERQKRIEELKRLNASFDDALFGESTAVFNSAGYGKPEVYPTAGVHPRVNLAGYMIDDIKRTMEDPEMAAMVEMFWKYAELRTDGKLPVPNVQIETSYNWDNDIITAIEVKALAYLLTDNELYAQEAIYAIKNYILDLVMTTDAQGDLFYAYGTVMRVAAQVYDWCYPTLTEKDKNQIIAGVENYHASKMTIGCPPYGMNGIQGHGTSSQLACDYVAFSLAIYDERPDWWELVGARVYNEWYPFINYYYQTNYWNQGTSTYADNKFSYHVRSAWLIKALTGENPLPNIGNVLFGLLANQLPNGNFFPTGDGTVGIGGATAGAFTLDKSLAVIQALHPTPGMQLIVKDWLNGYKKTYMSFSGYPYTCAMVLVWRSQGSKTTAAPENKYDDVGTVSYAPSPLSQVIARSSWNDADAPAIFMRIAEVNVGNHEHEDSGTFQIYYKGLLTGNTGYYGGSENLYDAPYGSTHHKYYHQATVSSNGFLVFNPSLAGEDPSVPDKYYYSGGQISTSGAESFEQFLNEPTAKKGETTGFAYEYREDGVTPKYAYIAGDISQAYDSRTVEFIERRMLAIFTDDESYPMLFYVFDNVFSVEEDFRKTFLLHTTYEPTIDGNVVTSVVGEGKLVLTSLLGGAEIQAVGGEGKWFLVNGHPCSPSEKTSNQWGRVEISTSGSVYTGMLNAMYVTDAANDEYLKTELIADNELCIAAKTDGTIVVFAKGKEKNASKLEFEFSEKGLFEYYVSGMSVGSWSIRVDGVTVAHLYSYDDEGFLNFTAPSGKIEIVPGDNVKPANSGSIRYNLNGATLPEGTPEYYVYDEVFVLPDPIPLRETQTFAGWYTDTTYANKITEIPVGTRGPVKVYAMFYENYVENYETSTVDLSEKNSSVGIMNYVLKDKAGSSVKTVTEDGNTYLLWQKGEFDPRIGITKSLSKFLLGRKFITFSFDVALDGNNPAAKSYLRLRGESSSYSIMVFGITADGKVLLGNDSAYPITTLTNEFQTITVTADLENEMLYAYDEDGNTVAQMAMSKPSIIENVYNWAATNEHHVFDWYGNKTTGVTNSALRIDNIEVTGEYHGGALVPPGEVGIFYENMSGGALPEGAPTSFKPGVGLDALPTPSSEIYDFLGWYADAEFTSPITTIPSDRANEITVYAKWQLSDKLPEGKAVILYKTLGGKYELDYSLVTLGDTLKLGTPEKSDLLFGGWYTDPSFDPVFFVGDEITPENEGTTVLYAKFYRVTFEDFENTEIDVTEAQEDIKPFRYVGSKPGASFKTVTDGDGNTYLLWTQGTNDPELTYRTSLPLFLDTMNAISFELDVAKNGESSPMYTTFRLRGKSSKYGAHIFGTGNSGAVYLGSSPDNKLFDISEEFQKIRITVDFEKEAVYAFDESGAVVRSVPFLFFFEEEMTKEEFVDSCTVFIFDWYSYTSGSDDAQLRIDNLKIQTGYPDGVSIPKESYAISYENLTVGTLPSDAPAVYYKGEGLATLPVPTSKVYNFLGWYKDAEFTEQISSIPSDMQGNVTLFAKWELPENLPEGIAIVNYETFGATYSESFTVVNTGESLTLGVPTLDGFDFVGWYTSRSFNAASYIGSTYTPDKDGEVTLYASFVKTHSENFDALELDLSGEDTTHNSFKYVASKEGASFKALEDERGGKYLLWTKGTKDPSFDLRRSLPEFLDGATKLYFTFDVALDGDSPALRSYFRIRGTSSSNSVVLFWIGYDGTLNLGEEKGPNVTTLTDEFITVRIMLDTEREMICSLDSDGNVTAEYAFVYPEAYSSIGEYLDTCTSYTFNWYGATKNNTDAALRIDNVTVSCGF